MSAGTNIDWLLHIYFTRKDFVRCKSIIDRELYRHLNPEYLYFIKGLIEREEGNAIEALRNLQQALDLNPKNIETYKEIGKTLYEMGRYNQALDVFREAEGLSPRADFEIFHYIGELLHRSAATQSQLEMALKEQAQAKIYFQQSIQYGKKTESYQRLAEIYRNEKDYGKAIEILESCLALTPENTEVLTEIGVLYLKINETQKSFDRLSEVINVDNKSPRGLLAYGAILQSRNDVDGALGKYKEIAAAEPDIAELWNNIGLCFFKKQKLIVAISSLRKSIWLSPLNYNALYNLSLIYITAQQYASAFHTLAAAINLRKDNAECYMLLGMCLRKLEDTENAFTAFERSSSILTNDKSSRNPLIYLNFALFCYETGRFALAAEHYNRFISDSHDMLLPTEYKFQATKLKSLLRISTNSILTSPTARNIDQMDRIGATEITSTARMSTAMANTNILYDKIESNKKKDIPLTSEIGISEEFAVLQTTDVMKEQTEILPLEVNAVVNTNATQNEGGGTSTKVKSKTKPKSKAAAVVAAMIHF